MLYVSESRKTVEEGTATHSVPQGRGHDLACKSLADPDNAILASRRDLVNDLSSAQEGSQPVEISLYLLVQLL